VSHFHSCGPPPAKPLTTSGGVRNTALLKKKDFFLFLAIFACFTTSSFRSIFGQTKMDFKNPREVFSQHWLKNKNLSQVLQQSYEQGESKTYSRPIFPYFQFSVTVLILQELLRPYGDELSETEGGFCPAHTHIQ
jgi:hypothetical protein